MNAKRLATALVLWAAFPLAAAAGVSKEDVEKLARAGLSDDVILSFIRANGPAPKLSADDLVELKQAGASDRVLAVLAGTTSPAPPSQAAFAEGNACPPPATYVVREPVVYASAYSIPWYYACWGWPSYYYGYPYRYYVYLGYPRYGCYPPHGTLAPRGYSGVYVGSRPSLAHSSISLPSSGGYRASSPSPAPPSRGYGSRLR